MIGRTHEVEALREAAAADRSRFVVVYGRRRVGKTFLIREAFDYRFAFSRIRLKTWETRDWNRISVSWRMVVSGIEGYFLMRRSPI